jgi:endonuclease/exonuclease/phosphatase family metal-dependent hydrolase
MKKSIILALFAAFCTLAAGCADDFETLLNDKYYEDDTPSREPDITEQTLSLGCYNLWISGKGTGDYLWSNRRTVLAQSIVKNEWDIFGFQEANATIRNELPTLVEQQGGSYEWWFVGRDSQDGTSGEALGIAYNPDRFELSDKHFFWISPTPDEMSYGWDELGYYRIAACAMVTDKLYNKQFFMMVTHAPLAAAARAEGAKLLIEREKMYNPGGIPSILVGDMNATMDDASSKTLRTHWNDSFLTVDSDFISGPVGTFNGHKTSADLTQATARIDYIYVRGDVELKTYKVDNTVYGNIYPSDHCPLTIRFDTDYEKPAPDEVEGSGTAADPWQLNSVSDWNTVAASINGPADDAVYASTAYYKLTADIDFNNKNFTPIGFSDDNTASFEGEFDGAGHKLLNVKIVAPGKSCGVFGSNKGTIRNLAVEGALSTEFEIAGGIVGVNSGVVDGATFKGDITGGANAKTLGGIAGQNRGTIVNCANLGGTMKTDAPKDPNMGGIAGQIAKGDDGSGRYVINCYSRVDRLEALHNNVGGIVGIVSDNSFVINCYSTVEEIVANSSCASVVGYSKIGNLQNIYGNSACPSKSAANAAVGSDKKAGTVWSQTTFALLSLGEMKSGAVTVPSSNESCDSFVAALNAGAAIFNDTPEATLPGKPNVVLRKWVASESCPVLE